MPPHKQFRTHIQRRSNLLAEFLLVLMVEFTSKSKVNYYSAIMVNDDIFRFQIPVHYLMIDEILEGLDDCFENVETLDVG